MEKGKSTLQNSRQTRREWLRLGTIPMAYFMADRGLLHNEARAAGRSKDMTDARNAVDHLLLGIADLDRGIAWVEERTGVEPVVGGSHPGVGTRNALISLGNRQYLEIIALDPAQSPTSSRAAELVGLTSPRLITWAAATGDIRAAAQRARESGCTTEGPNAGSRARPDGRILRWKTLGIRSDLGGVIPFFIEWGNEVVHPSADSPAGCRLRAFELVHPQPERVAQLLCNVGIEAKITQAKTPMLRAVLDTPRGPVELS